MQSAGNDQSICLLGVWLQKLLHDPSFDPAKSTWIGKELIDQFSKNRELFDVIGNLEHIHLPIGQLNEMFLKKKEIEAFLDETDDLDNFTVDEVTCVDCEESNEKIKELQKVHEKLQTVINSNNKLLNDFETYLIHDLPKLTEQVIAHYDEEGLVYESKFMDKVDPQYRDIFQKSNENLIITIQTSIEILVADQKLKNSQEVNKLQDKIIELQRVVTDYARMNDETQTKLKKYKSNCLNYSKMKAKLEEKLSLMSNEHSYETALQKVNEGIKNRKLFIEVKARNDRFMNGPASASEQIGDF